MDFIKKHFRLFIILYCFIISFILLLICSKNSFLYPFNDWEDANMFYTLGKGWAHGLIPYRDLFEQKGPFLYLIYLFGYLICKNKFYGIFLLEVISFTIFLYYSYKIIKLYLNKKYSLIILPLLACSIICITSFKAGGSAEEFCLPFIMIGLYYLLRYIKYGKISNLNFFLIGILAGLVGLIKYTLLGFYIGFGLIFLIEFLVNKQYKKCLTSALLYILGILLPIIVFVLYFYFNNGLKDFIDQYIIINTTAYSKKIGLKTRFMSIYHSFFSQCGVNFKNSLFLFMGLGYLLFTKEILKEKKSKLYLIILFVTSVIGLYYGGSYYIYYYLPLTIFAIFGFIGTLKQFKINNKTLIISLPIIIIITLFFSFRSENYKFTKVKKEELPQYKFAEIINKKDNPTLLTYGTLDYGYFLAADILPSTKYFDKNNIGYKEFPEMMDSQNEIVMNKKVDFVTLRNIDLNNNICEELLFNNYKLATYEPVKYTNYYKGYLYLCEKK